MDSQTQMTRQMPDKDTPLSIFVLLTKQTLLFLGNSAGDAASKHWSESIVFVKMDNFFSNQHKAGHTFFFSDVRSSVF